MTLVLLSSIVIAACFLQDLGLVGSSVQICYVRRCSKQSCSLDATRSHEVECRWCAVQVNSLGGAIFGALITPEPLQMSVCPVRVRRIIAWRLVVRILRSRLVFPGLLLFYAGHTPWRAQSGTVVRVLRVENLVSEGCDRVRRAGDARGLLLHPRAWLHTPCVRVLVEGFLHYGFAPWASFLWLHFVWHRFGSVIVVIAKLFPEVLQ